MPVIFVRALQKEAKVLAHRVRRALVPAVALGCLPGGKNLNEAFSKVVGFVAGRDVAVQGLAVKLRYYVDLAKTAVEAIANRDVHQTMFAAQRHRWLSALLGYGKKAGAGPAAQGTCVLSAKRGARRC